MMSVGAYMHCLAEGLSIPTDLALAGFNNLDLLKGLPMQLATTDAHRFEIGQRAAQIILDAGAGKAGAQQFVELDPKAIAGQSL